MHHFQVDDDIRAVAAWAGQLVKAAASPQRPIAKTHGFTMRPGHTYRGARRNEWRHSQNRSEGLLAVRTEMGLSRRAFDRLRHQSHQLGVKSPSVFEKPKAPVIRLQPMPLKAPERELTEFDKAQLAKAAARREMRNGKRAKQSQAHRRAA